MFFILAVEDLQKTVKELTIRVVNLEKSSPAGGQAKSQTQAKPPAKVEEDDEEDDDVDLFGSESEVSNYIT